MTFAERLSYLMQRDGMTKYRLSKIVGCSATTVANWLSGKEVTPSYLQKLSEIFKVSTDYLIGGNEKAPTQEGERVVSDDDIKFALFGTREIDDDVLEQVKSFAKFARENRKDK